MVKSSDMFIHMDKELVPKWDDTKHFYEQKKDVLDFWEEERQKVKNGVNIGGYKMSPWLYWHINHFVTPIPTMVDGLVKDVVRNPPLDDNELYIDESLTEAGRKNKALFLFGCRGFRKTSFIASYTQFTTITKPDGVFTITGGDAQDLGGISSMMDKGFNQVAPAFFIPTLEKDWESYIRFGFKDKSTAGKSYVHSEIRIINANKGQDGASEKGAGLSPNGYVMDEALQEDTVLHTEYGEVPIKNIQIGDKIFGQDGELTTVIDKIDVGIVDIYEFELSDGRTIQSSSDHLWTVYNTQNNIWEIKSTISLSERYYQKKFDKRYNKHNQILIYSIPLNLPINYEYKKLEIDPYWFGMWLGDGNKNFPIIYTIDDEIAQFCEKYAEKIQQPFVVKSIERHCRNGSNFRILSIIGKDKKNNYLLKKLQTLNLIKNKHIPEVFLLSSIEQRLSILQGLMDTDGSVVKSNHAEFTTSQPKLAKDFETLCRSLGISLKSTISKGRYTKDGISTITKNKYRFSLKTELPIFRLSRKIEIFNNGLKIINKKQIALINRTTIKKITKLEHKSQAYCIKVDNDNKLFIAGDFIVTHNCGKYAFRKIFKSALPAFRTPYGYRLTPILSGTSGNEELSKDARYVLENIDEFDILPLNFKTLSHGVPEEYITWAEDKGRKFATFVPGQMSSRLESKKIPSNLAQYTGDVNNVGLKKINVGLTNWKEATEIILSKRDGKKEDLVNSEKMYYPLNVDECFLTTSANPFPVDIIDRRIRELEMTGDIGTTAELFKNGSKVEMRISNKKRAGVEHKGGNVDAPVIIYNGLPDARPEKYFTTAGLDDYKLNVSETDSYGAMYVLNRRGLSPDTPCETIAASYVSRPERHRDFHANCELMLEAFNAECLMEAIDVMFEEYMDVRGKAYDYLAPAISFAKSNPKKATARMARRFGLMPTASNNEYRMNVLVDWANEIHVIGFEEDGTEIVKYSVEFLDDIELLKELRDWKKGKNSDRKEAFSHALLHAKELDKNNIRPKSQTKHSNILQISSSNKKKGPTISAYTTRRFNPYGR